MNDNILLLLNIMITIAGTIIRRDSMYGHLVCYTNLFNDGDAMDSLVQCSPCWIGKLWYRIGHTSSSITLEGTVEVCEHLLGERSHVPLILNHLLPGNHGWRVNTYIYRDKTTHKIIIRGAQPPHTNFLKVMSPLHLEKVCQAARFQMLIAFGSSEWMNEWKT